MINIKRKQKRECSEKEVCHKVKHLKKSFVLDEFLDNGNNRITYPNHAIILGPTQSGKTTLLAKMFDSINEVYRFSTPLNGEKKMIVISPIEYLEIADKMKTSNEWSMALYSSSYFDSKLISEIKDKFKESNASVKILLIDDFFMKAAKNPKQIGILNEIYSFFRHMNVSVFSTMHSYNPIFKDLVQQAAVIICMFTPSIFSILRSILRPHYFLGTADLVRRLKNCYIDKMKIHDYLIVYNTKESFGGQNFYISNNIFNPRFGITNRQFLE